MQREVGQRRWEEDEEEARKDSSLSKLILQNAEGLGMCINSSISLRVPLFQVAGKTIESGQSALKAFPHSNSVIYAALFLLSPF